MKKSLSVVMGMYNEAENVRPVTSEVGKALKAAEIPYEIICVSNGSTDDTEAILTQLSKEDPRMHGIVLKEKGYGAAYSLREMLTIKSDDILGRSQAFDSIVKGEAIKAPNIPASFSVALNELRGLGLDVELKNI